MIHTFVETFDLGFLTEGMEFAQSLDTTYNLFKQDCATVCA